LIKRKQSAGFNLAFLDIMSCGLGAIILVFMLVKHNVNDSSVELDNLQNDIQQLEEKKLKAQQIVQNTKAQLAENSRTENTARKELAAKQAILSQTSADIELTSKQLELLKSAIKTIKVLKKDDLIETQQVQEQHYLLGLKVEGPKIAILVDNSASMTHEKLIDIIKTKNGSSQEKQQAEKWIRTQKVVAWLLARLPKNSDVIVVAFNEKAKNLGSANWAKANSSSTINAILSDLNTLVPEGATNLQQGLQAINTFSPSNLYIITDGLPTKGESRYKSLNPFASCSSLSGNSTIISGECRVKLFKQTIKESAKSNIQVNVILLPLEGDPDATNQYWSWTAATGGLVLSPAGDWP